MKLLKRGLSILLSLSLFMTSLVIVSANDENLVTALNGNITVSVSEKNGGFVIRTVDGDKLNKDDDNKDLLYRSGEYDTSFTSLRITEEGKEAEEYIFGNNYSFLGLGGNNLEVSQDETGITAVWEVNGIAVTQRLEPVVDQASENHGLVEISYSVVNNRNANVKVEVRLLLDTALGEQDYAYYSIPNDNAPWTVIYNEQSLEGDKVPTYFEANNSDDMWNITGYSVLEAAPDVTKPYKVTFAHWNNLASTIFDYTPNPDLAYVSHINAGYRTADSAVASYYDLGSVARGGSGSFKTYYGVRSRIGFDEAERTVDITVNSPASLELNEDKTAYISPYGGEDGKFRVTTNLLNIKESYPHVAMAVYTDAGIVPLDNEGNDLAFTPSRENPQRIDVYDFGAGAANSKNYVWDFKADVDARTTLRRIEFRVYNMEGAEDLLLEENVIGDATIYVLCPGGDGDVEKIAFTSLSPDIVYFDGTRRLYIAGSGFDFLEAKTGYAVRAINTVNPSIYYDIPMDNIYINGTGSMDVVLDQKMEEGTYKLMFICGPSLTAAGIEEELTAPVLTFYASDEPKYRNDSYGVIAIFTNEAEREHEIEYYVETYESETYYDKHGVDNLLLEFKGYFAKEEKDENTTVYTSVLSGDNNTVVINQALDFKDGTMTVTETKGTNGGIKIAMDGSLTTNASGTYVSEGKINITELKNGRRYELVNYDEFGERQEMGHSAETIALTWASDFLGYSMFEGFPVQIRDAVFGKIHKRAVGTADVGDFDGYTVSFAGGMNLRFLMPGEQPLGIEAKDVMFGRNEGYMGVNAEGSVIIPGFARPIGALAGTFSANTINNHYTVGVNGTLELVHMFEAEFELVVKEGEDSPGPIPDRLGIYLRNFRPGQPIGPPILFLTGGGGGYDELYDTIYLKGGVPPLTLDMMAQISLLRFARSEAAIKLSLGGFAAGLGPMVLEAIPLQMGPAGELSLSWAPDLYVYSRSEIDIIYGLVRGSKNIGIGEVNDRFLAEVYINAFIKLPTSFILGTDIELAEAGLGVSSERLWGVARVLGIGVGVAYYWDDDIELSTKDLDSYKPEFKSEFEQMEVPVYYDEENDRTLMMSLGPNLMDTTSAAYMGSTSITSTDNINHTMKLGQDAAGGVIITMEFDEEITAEWAKENIAVTRGGVDYFENATFASVDENGERNISDVNATLSVENGKSMLITTIKPEDVVLGEWSVTTTKEAEVSLTVVEPLPEIRSITASLNEDKVTVNYSGTLLNEAKVDFYVSDDEESAGILIGSLENPTTNTEVFTLPSNLPTGDYYIYAIAQNNDSFSRAVTENEINFVNPNTPDKPTAVTLTNAGNEYFEAEITGAEDADGYYVNVYEKAVDGTLSATDYADVLFEKGDELLIGGNYVATGGSIEGIAGGKNYVVGVRVYKTLADGKMIKSEETLSAETYLNEYTPPEVMFEGSDVYNTNSVSFTLKTNENVTGKIYINEAEAMVVNGTEQVINTTLSDGEHMIRFKGEDTEGNGFEFKKIIEVDTIAPTFMVTSPVNGSFFEEDGTVDISALTERGTLFTIKADGVTLLENANLDENIDNEGRLSIENVQVGAGKDVRMLEIIATDNAGNETRHEAKLKNSALTKLAGIKLMAENAQAGKNIILNEAGETTVTLKLYGETDTGLFEITDNKIASLSVTTVEGEATVSGENELTISNGAVGFVEGVLQVGEVGTITDYLAFGTANEQTESEVRVFFMDGNDVVGVLTADENGKINTADIPIPTKPGYDFEGWYIDEEYTLEVTQTTVFLNDTSCYAKWAASNELPFEAVDGGITIRHGQHSVDVFGEFIKNTDYTGIDAPKDGDVVVVVISYVKGSVPYMVTATEVTVQGGKITIPEQKLTITELSDCTVAGVSVLSGITALEAVTKGDLGTPVAVYKP